MGLRITAFDTLVKVLVNVSDPAQVRTTVGHALLLVNAATFILAGRGIMPC